MMDEYIKREDAEEALYEYRMSLTMSKFADMEACIESRGIVEGAMNVIACLPTADVVPKSEVAILSVQLAAKEKAYFELQHEFETYKGVEKIIDDSIPKLVEGIKEEAEKRADEIERLKRVCNSYALQYGTVTDQQKVIDKAKANVAREIFEEIERMCIDTFGNFNHRVFAELKKKYTEGDS